MSGANTWEEDEDGGLTLDPYYDDSQYDDDALDWNDDQDWESGHPEYDFEYDEYEDDDIGIAWEDMPLAYRIRANVGYWWIVNVRDRWRVFLVRQNLDRCPGCHKIYRFSGDHSNCWIPFRGARNG